MRKMNKFIAALGIVTIAGTTLPVNGVQAAGAVEEQKVVDIYAANYSETASIEGVTYKFDYSYDAKGNKVAIVENTEDQTTNVVTYNEFAGEVSMDGTVIATVTEEAVTPSGETVVTKGNARKAGWEYMGGSSKKVTWGTAAAVGVVATTIAIVLPAFVGGAAAVTAAVGASNLAFIAGISVGCTVYMETWDWNYMLTHQIKCQWSLYTGAGDYGPYTKINNVGI